MRRFSLAALCAALLLAACQDNTREPLGPSVDDQAPGLRLPPCSLPKFPIVSITAQIAQVFPKGPLLVEALAREAIIAALWTQCKPAQARQGVASFVGFTLKNFQSGKIGAGSPRTSTPAKVSDLIDAMLAAVQLSPLDLPLGQPGTKDFGTGFADGTSTGRVTVTTISGAAGASFPGNAWGEPTVVTIFRLPNDSEALQTEGENKFPPFYEYNASNASGNHFTTSGDNVLFVGFCLDDVVASYPENIAIGHNPPSAGEDFFEILDPLTPAQYATLGISTTCGTLANPAPPVVGLTMGEGIEALATSAWSTAAYYLGPVAERVLPARVFALVPKTTGVGGRTSSYSPFGVVEPFSDLGTLFHVDPQYSSETENTNVIRRVQLVSGESSVPGVEVTFTTEDGTLGNEEQEQVVTTDEDGQAAVTWVLPNGFPGVFSLTASVEGSTINFKVAAADAATRELSAFSCDLEDSLRSLNSFTPTNVFFSNELEGGQVSVFWLNTSGQREFPFEGGGIGVPYAVLDPGESYTQPTFVTHPWILTTPGEPEDCHGIFLPLSLPGGGTAADTVRVEEPAL